MTSAWSNDVSPFILTIGKIDLHCNRSLLTKIQRNFAIKKQPEANYFYSFFNILKFSLHSVSIFYRVKIIRSDGYLNFVMKIATLFLLSLMYACCSNGQSILQKKRGLVLRDDIYSNFTELPQASSYTTTLDIDSVQWKGIITILTAKSFLQKGCHASSNIRISPALSHHKKNSTLRSIKFYLLIQSCLLSL